LRNKEIGECIFRPSSMGNNNITLSYKFYKQIICHLDITEEDKLPGENIGKKLKISNEVYSSLDEIFKRYVIPCAQLIKESIKNRKFIHCDTKTDFENSLKEEKKKNTNIINYNYTILKDFPGYIVLGYVPKVNPIYEYIKIKPKGLYFHEQSFSSLDEITNYFKKEYSSEKYREMVRKSVAPTVQYHRSLESHSNINLDESKNYYNNYSFGGSMGLREGSIYGINRNKQDDRVCNICKKKGHIARNCKNRDSYMNEKRRNERGSSNYLGGKRNRDNRDNRDNYEHKKNYGGWDSRERAHGNNNWNSKDNNDENSWGHNSKKSDDNKGNDDGWGSDNNENQNNIKSENKNNIEDGW
jgi:transcription elongation factor SPT6